jgi:hypothetical protein
MLGTLQSAFREPAFLPKGGDALTQRIGPASKAALRKETLGGRASNGNHVKCTLPLSWRLVVLKVWILPPLCATSNPNHPPYLPSPLALVFSFRPPLARSSARKLDLISPHLPTHALFLLPLLPPPPSSPLC